MRGEAVVPATDKLSANTCVCVCFFSLLERRIKTSLCVSGMFRQSESGRDQRHHPVTPAYSGSYHTTVLRRPANPAATDATERAHDKQNIPAWCRENNLPYAIVQLVCAGYCRRVSGARPRPLVQRPQQVHVITIKGQRQENSSANKEKGEEKGEKTWGNMGIAAS